MKVLIVSGVICVLAGCASQPYHVTGIDEASSTITTSCFYSRNLHCRVDTRMINGVMRSNEATLVCRALGWGQESILRGNPRKIENPWRVGGRIEQDFECTTLIRPLIVTGS